MQIHVVRRGDTLWRLSRMYGVSVSSIVSANQLPNANQLVTGQALVVPTAADLYIIQPGDTLYYIAERYDTTVQELMTRNRIQNPSLIYSGQVLRLPPRTKRTIEVNAYLTDFGTVGQRTIQGVAPYLTYLSPFSHQVGADGSLSPLSDANVLQIAQTQGVTPLLVMTNFVGHMFNSDVAHAVLNTPSVQETLLTNVLNVMKSKGYRGLNIDFEYILPEDREPYNAFLRKVVDRMHQEGYTVSTALAPKVTASQQGLLYEAHDYPTHGQLADFVVLMTYEWGWSGGRPWAIAPINEVERVLDYAVTAIPRNKILMGVPTYAYDWKLPYVQGTYASSFDPQEAIRRAASYGVDIQFHPTYLSPYYEYTDANGQRHEVWFEDARSIQAKMDVVKRYRLRGVSYWELPSNFPQNWLVLADNFQIQKH